MRYPHTRAACARTSACVRLPVHTPGGHPHTLPSSAHPPVAHCKTTLRALWPHTGQNVRKLVKDGFVIRKPTMIHSRARARLAAEARSKGRHTGYGGCAFACGVWCVRARVCVLCVCVCVCVCACVRVCVKREREPCACPSFCLTHYR